MRALIFALAVAVGVWTAVPAQAAAKKNPAKKAAAQNAPAKKAPAKKPSTTKTSAKKVTKKPAAQVARTPQQPTPERYAEIEQALVERGYLSDADGKWGADSVAALKKFQADQQLKADGKLGALSLTALGLGPRRGAFVVAPEVLSELAVNQVGEAEAAPTPLD